jgi:predicted nucleic acid-binding protein
VTLAVTDASVALKLFLAEEGSEESEKLQRRHDLIAPDLVLPEILNALWKAHRRGLVGDEQAKLVAASIAQPFFALVPAEELLERSWDIAVALDVPLVKFGVPRSGERISKQNCLLRIEEELGPSGHFAGKDLFGVCP